MSPSKRHRLDKNSRNGDNCTLLCFICCSKVNLSRSSKSSQNYFILRHIIEFPEDEITYYKTFAPDTDRWISVCETCSKKHIKKCSDIYAELKEIERRLKIAKDNVCEAIKLSVEEFPVRRNPFVRDITQDVREFVCNQQFHTSSQRDVSLDSPLPRKTSPSSKRPRRSLPFPKVEHTDEDDLEDSEDDSNDSEFTPGHGRPGSKARPSPGSSMAFNSTSTYIDCGGKLFQCQVCPYETEFIVAFKSHMAQVHSMGLDMPVVNVPCPKCGKKFSERKNMLSHFRYVNCLNEIRPGIGKNRKRYSCPHCGRTIKERNKLQHHINAFHKNKKIKCRDCEFRTTELRLMSEHERTSHGRTDERFEASQNVKHRPVTPLEETESHSTSATEGPPPGEPESDHESSSSSPPVSPPPHEPDGDHESFSIQGNPKLLKLDSVHEASSASLASSPPLRESQSDGESPSNTPPPSPPVASPQTSPVTPMTDRATAPPPKFKCRISNCEKLFYHDSVRDKHEKVCKKRSDKKPKKKLRCNESDCEETFESWKDLHSHKKSHSSKSVAASVVKVRKTDKSNKHKNDKPTRCDLCGTEYSTPHYMGIHQAEAHLVCGLLPCRKRKERKPFDNLEDLWEHQESIHERTLITHTKCDHCGKIIKKSHMLKHLQETHPDKSGSSRTAEYIVEKVDGSDVFPCPECSAELQSITGLDQHMRISHAKLAKKACEVCGEKLVPRGYINHQMQLHNICPVKECGIEMNSLEELFRHHKKEHKGEHQYMIECPYKCGKILVKRYMRNHIKTHK